MRIKIIYPFEQQNIGRTGKKKKEKMKGVLSNHLISGKDTSKQERTPKNRKKHLKTGKGSLAAAGKRKKITQHLTV
ncbi:MAG: hypothetical protein PUF56_00105 [Lachnospiraceae bacterium]|nr:hypothetical protein [Lachnospiraceae bacterium]